MTSVAPKSNRYIETPISQEIARYVSIPPKGVFDQAAQDTIQNAINLLQKDFDLFISLCSDEDLLETKSSQLKIASPDPFYLALMKQLGLIQEKLHCAVEDSAQFVVRLVSQMISILKDCSSQEIAVNCRIMEFHDFISSKFRNDPTQIKIKRHVHALDQYIMRNFKTDSLKKETLQSGMQEVSQCPPPPTDYYDYNFLDEQFSIYMAEREENSMIPTENSLIVSSLNDFLHSVSANLEPQSDSEYLAISSVAIRYYFSYLSYPPAPIESFNEFCSKCQQIISMTPTELAVTDFLIKPGYEDMPFTEMALSDSNIQKAAEYLEEIQFYTTPIDISNLIYLAMKSIEQFANANSGTSSLSFDDLFSIFYPIFAMRPATNCQAVSDFLSGMQGFIFSPTFDFTRMVYTSAVSYIKKFKK